MSKYTHSRLERIHHAHEHGVPLTELARENNMSHTGLSRELKRWRGEQGIEKSRGFIDLYECAEPITMRPAAFMGALT